MLIRCDIDAETGLGDIRRCKMIGDFFADRGYRIAYAINKDGYERARHFLGETVSVYRIPPEEEEEIQRIGHLHRKHKHQIIFINRRKLSSAYLFHIRRLFSHTALLDHGSQFLVYADTLINPAVNASNHRYDCAAEARLLLGPKFFITDPRPSAPPSQAHLTHLLLDLGEKPQLVFPILEAFSGLSNVPLIHVLCKSESILIEKLAELDDAYPGIRVAPVLEPDRECFAYGRYPFIVTEAGLHCLDFAREGLFFINLCEEKERLEEAYAMDQLGISPSLGWFASKKQEDIRALLKKYLQDPDERDRFTRMGPQMVDGRGLDRIAPFIPAEDK